ncbi:MAG: hypothetical protein HOP97_06165, partial [Terrabacter sp.]|nr:hypothetical protein [Terrabacter sp.]
MAPNENTNGENSGEGFAENVPETTPASFEQSRGHEATLFPAETGHGATPADGAEVPAEQAPAAEKAPRRRATRRTTKKAAAEPGQGTEQASEQGVEAAAVEAAATPTPDASVETTEGDGVTAAAKRPVRKRATRKKAADADEAAPAT